MSFLSGSTAKSLRGYFNNPDITGETKTFLKKYAIDKIKRRVRVGLKDYKITAEKMQSFLNALKNTSNAKKGVKDVDISSYINGGIIEELRGQLPADIFRIASKEHSTKGQLYDDIFEKDINTVLERMATTTKTDFYDGQKTATSVFVDKISTDLMKDIKKALGDDLLKEIQKKIQKNVSEEEKESLTTLPSARAQKSDISTIEITGALKPKYAEIVDLFSGYRFTIKNYGSGVSETGIKVELGSSNPLKAFVGTLTTLGVSQPLAIKAFFASTAAYLRDQDEELASYIFALRFYYELTGAGLIIDGKRLSEVDFIIVNNPNGRIIVKSTKEILNAVFSEAGFNNYLTGKYDPFRTVVRNIPY